MNNLDMNSPMNNFFNPEGHDDANEGVSARGYAIILRMIRLVVHQYLNVANTECKKIGFVELS